MWGVWGVGWLGVGTLCGGLGPVHPSILPLVAPPHQLILPAHSHSFILMHFIHICYFVHNISLNFTPVAMIFWSSLGNFVESGAFLTIMAEFRPHGLARG